MNISLFSGAGISVQFGMDTTADFKTKLVNDIKLNPKIPPNQPQNKTTFASLITNPDLGDIEEVLHAIKELTENITNPDSFPKHAKIAWSTLTLPEAPTFKNVLPPLSTMLVSVKTQINNLVFNAYNWNKDHDDHLKIFYSRLFKILCNKSNIVNIGTTNYDQSVEKFCVLPNSKYDCHDGFVMHDSNDKTIFSADNFNLVNTDNGKIDVRLFKIHGSINWKKEGDDIIRVSEKSIIGNNDRVFISPTLDPKGDVKNEPFNSLNRLFNKHLQESDICVIIGYSFRDEHINDMFREFLQKSKKQIIIISPTCKSNFVRNYHKKQFTENEEDHDWLKRHHQKNIHFLEYGLDTTNGKDVLVELETKISEITSKVQIA